MTIYRDWGFSDNPFQTTALPPNSVGRSLLVGRDKELGILERRLKNPPKLPTLEGLNGVGKSSLVNVAAFNCYESFLCNPDEPMLIPCRKIFQLRSDVNIEAFIEEVLREVAQTLIEEARKIEGTELAVSSTSQKLDKWLNSAQTKSYQVGLGPIGGGYSTETNTGEGFSRSGFRKLVSDWLRDLFSTQRSGGVICVIDNLELLQTSEAARRYLEALRDELLTIPGLRWVLCGALGIVIGVATSPRLEGFFHAPVEIGGVDDTNIERIYSSRIDAFAATDRPYLPLTAEDFRRLYSILSNNLRSLLGHADDFCQWVADRDAPTGEEEKRELFTEWLREVSLQALSSAQGQLRPRAWRVFDDAIRIGGSFSPSDYEKFDLRGIAQLRPHVRDLEAAGLVVSTQDEGDKRRKTIQITPKGWLVQHAKASAYLA